VHEVGIETVLQEGSGAFMLYYERVRNGERRSSVWSTRHFETDDVDDDIAREVGGGGGGGEKAETYRSQDALKWESSEEEEKEKVVPMIRARVVRSVSLGREDDDEGMIVKQEVEEADLNSEARFFSSSTPVKPEPIGAEPAVELPTLAVSTNAPPPPIPDTPTGVDEPPIAVFRT
jgi:hypothetical protein